MSAAILLLPAVIAVVFIAAKAGTGARLSAWLLDRERAARLRLERSRAADHDADRECAYAEAVREAELLRVDFEAAQTRASALARERGREAKVFDLVTARKGAKGP